MSEKRFVCIDVGYGDDWYITDNGKRLSEIEIVDLLNEQQATISKLEEENGHFKKELKRFKDWINSDKYDYELTLSFIKNKGYSLQDVLEYEKELKE